jgi:serine beta-lactamase-like protein LACTB
MLKKIAICISTLVLIVIFYASWVGAYLLQPWVATQSIPANADLQINSQHYDDTASELMQMLDAKLPLWRQQTAAPSISVAVGYQGKLLWSGSVGYRDLDQPLAADSKTLYRIGSTSKALTATTLARLHQQGLIELDRPIGEYLPDLPDDKKVITLRQLMSHSAGIRHYRDLWLPPFQEYYMNTPYESVDEAIQLFIHDPLISKPGENFNYSSNGFNLASRVIEAASGKSFPEIVNQEVLRPLKMNRTFAEGTSNHSNIAKWYLLMEEKDSVRQARKVDNSVKWAGGGFLSSPEDLVTLGQAWLDLNYLSEETRQTFLQAQTLNNGMINPQSYALGWRSEKKLVPELNQRELQFFHHGGTANGSSTYLVVFPEQNIVVAASVNALGNQFSHISSVCFDAAKILYERSLDHERE